MQIKRNSPTGGMMGCYKPNVSFNINTIFIQTAQQQQTMTQSSSTLGKASFESEQVSTMLVFSCKGENSNKKTCSRHKEEKLVREKEGEER